MEAYREINLRPSRKELLQFALVVAGGAAVLGVFARVAWGNPHAAEIIWTVGAAIAAGALVPGVGRLLYVAWMGLGVSVGLVTGPVVLGVCYALVITPVALIFRMRGRDVLERRVDRSAVSYWKTHATNTDMSRYYKQY